MGDKEREQVLSELLPPLTEEEFEALKADIAERGVQVPIEYDEDGNILDGHHRVRACQELGIKDWPRIVRVGLSEEEKIEHILSLNLNRRHLTKEEKKKIAKELRRRGWSYRRIAKVLGCAESTIRAWLKDMEDEPTAQTCAVGDEIPYVRGLDGKLRPARKPKPGVFVSTDKEQERLEKLLPKVKEELPEAVMTASKVAHLAKQKEIREAEEKVKAEKGFIYPPIVIQADSLQLDLSEKYDLLITDPPYMTEIDDIEGFAQKWLPKALNYVKDEGFAFVFIGAYPRELRAYLNAALPDQILVWTYQNTLGVSPKDRYRQNWQAILFFRMPKSPPLNCPLTQEQWSVQAMNAPGGTFGFKKRLHTWEKPIELAERLIRHTTKPGDTVLDLFAGTGTFLIAAAQLGRKAIGYEIDPGMIEIAKKRGCVVKTKA